MKHKVLQAKAVATDLGEFTAIAAAYSVDRGNERIVPGAFAGTIKRWQSSEKMIPLHWDHDGSPESIIGVVDPATMLETDEGLSVTGKLDLEGSAVAKEAWRAMRANALSLSFGYMVTDGGEAKDGVYEIKGIDLFEISITPAPMNPDTRFLDLKSMAGEEVPLNLAAYVKANIGAKPVEGLLEAGAERFGGENTHVYVDDWDHDSVVFCVSDPDSKKYLKLTYTGEDDVELGADEAEVTRTVSYVSKDATTAIKDAGDKEPSQAKSQAQDPLKHASREAMLEVLSGGMSLHKYEEVTPEPPPEPSTEDAQRRRFCDLTLT